MAAALGALWESGKGRHTGNRGDRLPSAGIPANSEAVTGVVVLIILSRLASHGRRLAIVRLTGRLRLALSMR